MTQINIAAYRLQCQQIADSRFHNPGGAVSWLGAVQAQDYNASLWAIGLRTRGATRDVVEQAIADGSLVRTWLMRGTLHFVEASDVRWMLELLAPRTTSRAERRMRELELDAGLIARASHELGRAMQGGHQLQRSEMYEVLEGAGISPSGQRGYHILWRCAMDGLICLSSRDTFALLDDRVPSARTLPREEALAAIACRYFTSRGPATLRDFVWWSGLPAADARAALESAGPQLRSETIDGVGYWMDQNVSLRPGASGQAFLLPAFDEFLVGYKDRSAVLNPAHLKRINAGGGMLAPVIVVGGRVAAVWRRKIERDAIQLELEPLTLLDPQAEEAVAAAVEVYARFAGRPVRVSRA